MFDFVTKENYSEVQSLVSRLSAKYQQEGNDKKSSRRMASEEVGIEYFSPPIEGTELESQLGRVRSSFSGVAADDNAEYMPRDDTYAAMYFSWCMNEKFVANDKQLGYFCGITGASFSYVRNKLIRKNGFIFSQREDGSGYDIEPPEPEPEKPEFTMSQVKAIVEEAIKKIGKQSPAL